MANPLWFKAKRYGYGWYPATKEGWLVMLAYALLMLLPLPVLGVIGFTNVTGAQFAAVFVPYTTALTIALLVIAARTGEKPRWRWGGE